MIHHLSPSIRAEIEPALSRWDAFTRNYVARCNDVLAEAEAGLTALIQVHALDYGPMGAAFNALRMRVASLQGKLDEAKEKTDEVLWEILFRQGIAQQDDQIVSQLRSEFLTQHLRLLEGWSDQFESMEARKAAEWATQLWPHVEVERAREVPCSHCGAEFRQEVCWQSATVHCPFCGSINTMTPGAACALFFQGGGAEALATLAAAEQAKALRHQERAYQKLRCATAYDHWMLVEGIRAYWLRYFQAFQQVHPGFREDPQAMAEQRVQQRAGHEPADDRAARDFYGCLVDAAQRGNYPTTHQLMSRPPAGVDPDECVLALLERAHLPGATLCLHAAYDLQGETDPREEWIREALQSAQQTLRP